ncbi:MAG: dihydroneopterin aldolase / 2-amino-4-hydroxy-6-hydroxymethyldihydropteridine diphosphokinase [Thermotogaceae bacterium]|nr:dihydroneopterin aldolase / 2-amino-4-hydroxy-6-hydroxymethyldihydropteridine diphosphokinase [Thermotogaceae bacterium]MDN5338334.1 dihydroneopterin aldolase / 2-amino-4-hydroxy-6-hydroxymethyldihydropteridine diphosphokinase [Thermotogaceae bacterium]
MSDLELYAGFGGNVGDVVERFIKAIEFLEEFGMKAFKKSSLYSSKPYGFEEQDDFVNCVVLFETDFIPEIVLGLFKRTERILGRIERFKWGPREIDIDILFYDSLIYKKPELTIPHKDIQNRDFVLRPMLEIAPDFVHPVFNKTIKELYSKLEKDSCQIIFDSRW